MILAAIECPTHSIVDAALRTLPSVLPVLDFSTIKNELFPVVATVFSRTNSLAIKVRGLQAFVILCGGSTDAATDDGLNGLIENRKKTSSSSALDKYTMQEKIVPLIKAIKTKEPAVMLAALNVLRIVGEAADADFVAVDILPVLWSMSLGPLLDLRQFQTFMELIKKLSRRVEDEQARKLQELSGTANAGTAGPNEDFLAFGGVTGTAFESSSAATNGAGGSHEDDFEALVKGKSSGGGGHITASSSSSNNHNNNSSYNGFASWDDTPSVLSSGPTAAAASSSSTPQTPSFSWSTAQKSPVSPPHSASGMSSSSNNTFRSTVTPDLARFGALAPSSTQFSQPLQPAPFTPAPAPAAASASSINWAASSSSSNPWASSATAPMSSSTSTSSYANFSAGRTPAFSSPGAAGATAGGSMAGLALHQQQQQAGRQAGLQSTSFSLPPPPAASSSSSSSMGIASSGAAFGTRPVPTQTWSTGMGMGSGNSSSAMQGARPAPGTTATTPTPSTAGNTGQPKSGLDRYESLI